jgi:predicted regulator of Ras-like GTPase activity (Roadblock/LC7/MglB family)
MTNLNQAAVEIDCLITEFVVTVSGVQHAAAISCDGLPLATSSGLAPDQAGQLAARASELVRVAWGAAMVFEGGSVEQAMVGLTHGLLMVMPIHDYAWLAVLATQDCHLGVLAYHMVHLTDRAALALTPAVQAELRATRSG